MSVAPYFCPFTRRVRSDLRTKHFLKRLGFALHPPTPTSDSDQLDVAVPSVYLPRLDDVGKLIRQLQDPRGHVQGTSRKGKQKVPIVHQDDERTDPQAITTAVGVSKPYHRLVHGTLQRELNGVFTSMMAHGQSVAAPPSPSSSSIDLQHMETFRIAVRGYVDQCVSEMMATSPPLSMEPAARLLASPASSDVLAKPNTTPEEALVEGLTEDQVAAFTLCRAGRCVYIGGNAGTGKSYLLSKIASWMETNHHHRSGAEARGGSRVLRTALTGIAAVNVNGHTLHSALAIEVPSHGAAYRAESFRSWAALRELRVLFIDEVSMLDASLLTALDEVARSSRGNSTPFGGIQIILSGDFMQLAPATTSTILEVPLFRSHFLHVALTQPMRQQSDPAFIRDLNLLRLGELPDSIRFSGSINRPDPDAVRLFPTRHAAAALNKLRMTQLDGPLHEFRSSIRVQQHSTGWCEAIAIHLFLGRLSAKRRDLVTKYFREALGTECGLDPDEIALNVEANSVNTTVVVLVRGRAWGKVLSGETSEALRTAAQKVIQKYQLSGCVIAQVPPSSTNGEGGESNEAMHDEPSESAQRSTQRNLERQTRLALRVIRQDPALGDKRLKKGCRVMLVRNLTDTLVNGSLGTIVDFVDPRDAASTSHHIRGCRVRTCQGCEGSVFPLVQFDDVPAATSATTMGDDTPTDVTHGPVVVPMVEVPLSDHSTEGFLEVSLRTLPLVPAFAFTVHKVQGVTLRSPVVLDCASMWRCPHMVYVAASRVQRLEHLRIINLLDHHVAVAPEALRFSQGLPPAASVAEVQLGLSGSSPQSKKSCAADGGTPTPLRQDVLVSPLSPIA